MAKSTKRGLPSTDSYSTETLPGDRVWFFDNTCEVCYVCDELRVFQGIAVCYVCKLFFEGSVTRREVYSCESGGCCSMIAKNRYSCSFCHLSKCFDEGLKAEKVGETSDSDCFLLKAKENIPDLFSEDLSDCLENDVETVRSTFRYALTTAAYRIALHPIVRKLEPAAQEEIIERCKRRGALAELIEETRDLTMEMLKLIRKTWEDDLQIPDDVFRKSLTFMKENMEVDQRVVTNYGERMENILQYLSICEEIAFPLVECTTTDASFSSSTSEEILQMTKYKWKNDLHPDDPALINA